MTDEFCLVTTSMDDRDFAYQLAKNLVDLRLAACVQVTPISSTYRWKGKINVENEYLLTIKTLTRLYTPLVKIIQEQHPYELPEILRLPVDSGFQPYLDWIKESVE
jgi:periplasmic divalent cation tolerance protein